MKNSILILLLFVFSCQMPEEYHEKITKTVVEKHEGTESDTKYEYNLLQRKWSLVPKIRTAHFLIYSDHTHEEVDLDTYMFTKIGDTRILDIVKYK